MIKAINEIACTGCGLCEKICPADLFRLDNKSQKMKIVYPADCCNCLQCRYICPVDAISFTRAEPKKINMDGEWPKIKELMGAIDNPQAEETKKPTWLKAKEAAMKNGSSPEGAWKKH